MAVSSSVRKLGVSQPRIKSAVLATLKAEGVREAMISVAFVGRAAIARLNQEYLGHRGATDVISFGFASGGKRSSVIGDIYICPDVARTNARSQDLPVTQEMLRLVIHGTLHVVGWDHPSGAARMNSKMWRKQERILARIV